MRPSSIASSVHKGDKDWACGHGPVRSIRPRPSSNLARHFRTLSVVVHSLAIASFAMPSAASRSADAWTTTRWGNDGEC
jgi:hypothetical protein